MPAEEPIPADIIICSIRLADEPRRGEILRWGVNCAQLGAVVGYAGVPGDWLITLDRSTNVAVAAAGSVVFSPATTESTHPRIREIQRMVAAVPQSEKAKLAERGKERVPLFKETEPFFRMPIGDSIKSLHF